MRILKNKEIKKLLIICIIIISIAFLITFIINKKQNDTYRKIINATISRIVNQIKQEYPNVDDEQIIQILNNKSNTKIKENVLKKYGLDGEESFIANIQQENKNVLIENLCIFCLTSGVIIFVFYLYLRKRQSEIDKLTEYVEGILNKRYDLAIDENSEDELNSLKNELYKITVMLKEEARNSTMQKEALAASLSDISHQLKTPLTSVLILLDNLSQSENMSKETREKFITEITRQIKGMNWLVISLLKLSRLDAGVVEFTSTKINANQLVEECLLSLEILAEIKNVSFCVQNKIAETFFYGDYNWNKEAIQNIIKNAVEHTKENTTITINIEENDVYTSISIKDNGDGISKKDLKHIFERFYKSESSSETSYGIGLSLSKSIIEKQNGYIEVETEEGKGTTFNVKYIK